MASLFKPRTMDAKKPDRIVLTEERKCSRRAGSIAIALALARGHPFLRRHADEGALIAPKDNCLGGRQYAGFAACLVKRAGQSWTRAACSGV